MQQYIAHPLLLEAIGIIGFGLYVLNYAMLSLGFVSGDKMTYFMVNLTAATCVLIGLASSFNLASALIQVFWIVLSLIAICTRLARAGRKQPVTA